jgi:glycosyltransferase involved in cell wall biosynthesis
MTFSIIIPAYNAVETIEATVRSALDSKPIPHEVIVVDDGSTDKTPSVCLSFGDKIRYVRVENGGVSRARNIGADIASGEWLLFLDADDLLMPDGPTLLLNATARKGASVAYGMVHERQEPPTPPRITGMGYA